MPDPIAAMGPTWTLAGPKLISEGITHRQMSRLLKDAAREAEARRAGAVAVLTKPWDASRLLAALEGSKGSGLRLLP